MRLLAVLAGIGLGSLLVSVAPRNALAQATSASANGTKRVLVGKFAGSKPQSTRDWLVQGLGEDGRYEVVGGDEATQLTSNASESDIASFAAAHGADAVLLGKGQLQKKGWFAEVSVYDGKDGHLIETVTIGGPNFAKYQAALIAGDEVDEPLSRAEGQKVEPPAATLDLEEEEEDDAPAEALPPQDVGPRRPSPLDFKLGIRLYGRSFRYSDSLAQLFPTQGFGELITYNLAAAPMPFGQLTWYPGAHVDDGWLAHVGVRGGYEHGVGTQVAYQGNLLDQEHTLWYAGLRGRIPVLDNLEFGLLGTFTNHAFSISGDEDAAGVSAFPDVDYKMIELGADAEWRIDQLILGAYGKYLLLLDSGPIQSAAWFPSASGSGVDFGGNIGWELSRVFDVLVGADARAYGLDFNPVAADAPPNRVAGGATDVYLSVWAGLGIRWPSDEPSMNTSSAATENTAPAGDDFDDFD